MTPKYHESNIELISLICSHPTVIAPPVVVIIFHHISGMIKIQEDTLAVQEQRLRSSNEASFSEGFVCSLTLLGHRKAGLFVIHCQTGEGVLELSWFTNTASFFHFKEHLEVGVGGLASLVEQTF